MAIFLDEPQVAELLDMDSCIAALDEAFREKAVGSAANLARRRLPFQGRRFHLMAGSMQARGYLGFKAYGAARGQDVMLYKAGEGIVAFLRSGKLGQVRTGAAAQLGARTQRGRNMSSPAAWNTTCTGSPMRMAAGSTSLMAPSGDSRRLPTRRMVGSSSSSTTTTL